MLTLMEISFFIKVTMLGSVGDGDIGEHFPNTPEWKDAEGSKLFEITNNLLTKGLN